MVWGKLDEGLHKDKYEHTLEAPRYTVSRGQGKANRFPMGTAQALHQPNLVTV